MEDSFLPSEPGTVVLVDDEPTLLRAYARILRRSSFDVEAFSTAREAIARVARGGVSVVVSDISMPGTSGIELMHAVHEHDAELPVVLMTGEVEADRQQPAPDQGAFDHVVKPFDPEALCAVVSKAGAAYARACGRREAFHSPASGTHRIAWESSPVPADEPVARGVAHDKADRRRA